MITYIYKQLKTNLIEVLGSKKTDSDELLKCKLIYELDNVNSKTLIQKLRPYQCLWITDEVLFKGYPEVIRYIDNKEYNNHESSQKEISEEEVNEELIRLLQIIKIITKNKVIKINQEKVKENKKRFSKDLDNITYLCDVYNYISDVYGIVMVRLIKEYEKLSPKKKEIIDTSLTLTTNEKQQECLNRIIQSTFGDDFNDLLLFLPEWYRITYKILGFGATINQRKTTTQVECTKEGNLEERKDDKKELLKEIIYKEFEIDETYSGNQIKTKLKRIYQQVGISESAKIKDLETYFDFSKINSRTSNYKLNTRKLL